MKNNCHYDCNVITLDGPAGAGKSTVARLLAERLGWEYLDTGALYRGITYFFLTRSIEATEEEKITRVSATVIVTRDSQKAIVIGKKGDKIKAIGRSARLEIEKFLAKKVFLELWVKVIPEWKENRSFLKEIRH